MKYISIVIIVVMVIITGCATKAGFGLYRKTPKEMQQTLVFNPSTAQQILGSMTGEELKAIPPEIWTALIGAILKPENLKYLVPQGERVDFLYVEFESETNE